MGSSTARFLVCSLILMGKPLPFCFVLLYIVKFRDEIPMLNEDLLCKAISAVHQHM
jgi:hypothetical protein